MIVRIHDVEVGLAIDGQAMRRLKLTRSGALPLSDGPTEFAVLGKLLHQPAHGSNPNPVLRIHTNTDRPVDACFEGRQLPAEAAEQVPVVSPGEQKFAVPGELLHAIVCSFRRVDVTGTVESQEMGPTPA